MTTNTRRWLIAIIAAGLVLLVLATPAIFLFLVERASRWKHSDLIRHAQTERIIPAARWVQEFRAERGRLPTDDEMRAFVMKRLPDGHAGIYRERPHWLDRWGVQGTDFIIGTSVSEWNLFYCSWDQRTLEYWSD